MHHHLDKVNLLSDRIVAKCAENLYKKSVLYLAKIKDMEVLRSLIRHFDDVDYEFPIINRNIKQSMYAYCILKNMATQPLDAKDRFKIHINTRLYVY